VDLICRLGHRLGPQTAEDVGDVLHDRRRLDARSLLYSIWSIRRRSVSDIAARMESVIRSA